MYDLIVIGAGAAGLLAATQAAENGQHVALLEKNRKAGVKILMSGGTRCNLTQNTDVRGIVEAFGRSGRFLHSALAGLGPVELVEMFRRMGVPTKVEATGKVFPVSDSAVDVQQALLRRLSESGAELHTGSAVRDLSPGSDQVDVHLDGRALATHQVLITTGGQSYPGCGTTGDGYAWAKKLGHHIVSPRPALVPLTTDTSWCRELQGVTIDPVRVAVIPDGSELPRGSQRRKKKGSTSSRREPTDVGSLLFTHFGLSGPVVMNVSREITARPHGTCQLSLDFLPHDTDGMLSDWFTDVSRKDGKRQIQNLLRERLPKNLVQVLAREAGVSPEQKLAEFSGRQRQTLLDWLKRARVPIHGTLGFKKAEVTAGGVSLDEVDSRTMQSKLCPRVYLAGEILDLDGPIGGYNFQAAFSTGAAAARLASRK